ncbi:MAG: hypothetical protein H6883_14875 [Rhodobiaceae bacterium]|nr:hypothetical protein [Rhodobiaceae bacterium]MCC0057403.1 hypothetical protein [Rhodobiaceae bacterium]
MINNSVCKLIDWDNQYPSTPQAARSTEHRGIQRDTHYWTSAKNLTALFRDGRSGTSSPLCFSSRAASLGSSALDRTSLGY